MESLIVPNAASKPRWQLVESYLSPIADWFRLPGVSEIMVNDYRTVFIERHGVTHSVNDLAREVGVTSSTWRDEGHLLAAIESIANALGQPVHRELAPILDARLPNGARINAAIPPIACDGAVLTIRIFPPNQFTWDDLAANGTFTLMPAAGERLRRLVEEGKTGLVTGAMRSGKTTLLSALIDTIAMTRRLVVVEDTRELPIQGRDVVRMEAAIRRGANPVGLHDLLRNAMRQSPHTLIVGEICDSRAAGVALEAMQLGHPVLSTLHASDAQTALQRLTKLALRNDPNIPFAEVRAEIVQAIDFIAHVRQQADGSRQLVELLDLDIERERLLAA